MKKFLGVLVAITLCACMLAPMASAAEGDLISDIFAGVDLGELSEADLSTIISDLGLEGIDVEAILGGDADALAKLEDAVAGLEGEETTAAQASGSTDGAADDIIGGMLGDLDAGEMDSLLGSVGDAFSDAGVDLENATPGSDVAGQVDSNNMMAGLMDTIFGALESLGLDTSMIEGMLDNDIVNFFANMYIGYVGQVEEETTTAAPETTTKKPVVVTTKTPDTGDTSAVFAALATITVASAAAFVCLKKKEN
ncbi:MAG: hypothetical protein IJW86_08370 [Clostridia bacterium]|nr:hypothetical protein [Clostridia bacterium]